MNLKKLQEHFSDLYFAACQAYEERPTSYALGSKDTLLYIINEINEVLEKKEINNSETNRTN